jgi:citronellol/citronellal dehydrogenase
MYRNTLKTVKRLFSDHSFSNNKKWNGYFVQKSLGMSEPNPKLKKHTKDLKGKTIFVSGGSRGIGLAIGLRAARDGANVVIAAKTVNPQPNLEGTIYTAAKMCQDAGGQSLAVQCNIQDEQSVINAINKTIDTFGSIDILINSASAIHLQTTERITMKSYDLMQSINNRGTFMVTKYCIPHIKNSKNGHILTLAPPIDALSQPKWFKQAGE